MPHPHGQIYAYPFLPKKLELELECATAHRADTGRCLYCDWMNAEVDFGKRVIFENDHFYCILPFYSEFVYGVHIISKAHKPYITDFDEAEKQALANAVRNAAGTLDSLFDMPFPYMMCMHNAPLNVITSYSIHYTKLYE